MNLGAAARSVGLAGRRGLRMALILPIRFYQYCVSPFLGPSCRFLPTCSSYAIEAVEKHGAGHGTYLAMRRLCRCHPWCEGGLDPVPPVEGRPSPSPNRRLFRGLHGPGDG